MIQKILIFLFLFFLTACIHTGILIDEMKEENFTKFYHYPFKVKSLKSDKYQIELSVHIQCEGFRICTPQKSVLTIIHKDSFVFLKGKKILLKNDKEMIDLSNDVMLTHRVDLFQNAPDGTTGIIIEKALIEIQTSDLNRFANSSGNHLLINEYHFDLPNKRLGDWKILTDQKLAETYLRENQKAKYLSKSEENTKNQLLEEIGAEKETWEMVKKSDQQSDYLFFIENFPESKFIIPAKLRIQQLESQ